MAVKTTPKGTASWAKLFRPDTKFVAEGVYSIDLNLPLEKAKGLIDYIDSQMEYSLDKAKKENPTKKGSIKQPNAPYQEVYDEEGNSTGEIKFKFKQRAVINTKQGPMAKKPAVVDAKGKPITEPLDIGNGSTVKVAFEAIPYFTAMAGAGVSLRLSAVQLIDLMGGSSSFGFEEEDGYEFSESDTKQANEDFNNQEGPEEETNDFGDF